MTAVTLSKQWIHFLRSFLCPPTSYISNVDPSISYLNGGGGSKHLRQTFQETGSHGKTSSGQSRL